MQISLGPACIVVSLAIAVYGVSANFRTNGVPHLGSSELSWVGEKRAPFLLAASIFGTQSFVSLVLIYVMKHMRELAECWGTGFLNMLKLYACMSFIGSVMYISKYCCTTHLAVEVDVGDYLFSRHVHWLFSTPIQWFVFSQLCTKSTWEDMRWIYIDTVLTQVFGMLLYFVRGHMRWFCFWASTFHFLLSYYRGFRLQLLKDMDMVGGRLRVMMFVVWTGFPVAMLLRWCDIIGPWEEQVLGFSVLDVSAKSVTFSAIIASRVVLSLARINGTVQLVLSSHDVTLTVNSAWQLTEDGASNEVIASCFGTSSDCLNIIDLCINEEHRNRLLEAAHTADNQSLGAPTPKVTVAFRLPAGGEEMLAECLVSKCLHGRRIVGIAVASRAGSPYHWQSEHPADEACDRAPSDVVSMSSTQSRSFDVQTRLALHNCSDVLQLPDQMARMVESIFMQSHTACAMFAWEASTAPAVVAASPRLQAIFFQGLPMPQPLACLAAAPTVDRMLLGLQAEDTIVHMWQDVQLPYGCAVEMTMLPLSRMSSMNFDVHLSVLVMVMADASERGLQPGYLSWKRSGGELVCTEATSAKAYELSPPRLLQPLIESYGALANSQS